MTLTKTAKTSIVVFGATLLSRFLGFARILAQASTLGFFRINDTYSFSNEIPNVMYELILGSLITSTLLPFFVKQYKNKNTKDDKTIFSFMFYASLGVTLFTISIAPFLAAIMTSLNNDADVGAQKTLVIFFLYFFLPQIFFYAMTSTMQTYLAARHKFVAAALAPILNNFVVITMLLIIKKVVGSKSQESQLESIKYILGIGTTLGIISITLFVTIAYKRGGGTLRLGSIKSGVIKDILHQSKWMVAYAMTNQVALFVIFALANKNESGVSIYLAAWAYFQLPHGLIAMNIITIAIPKFSHDIEYTDRNSALVVPEKTKISLQQTSSALIAIIAACSAIGIAISRPAMQLILVHGKVTSAQGLLSANVLVGFLTFGFAFSFYIFVVRLSNLIGKTREIFYINVVQNLLNIILAFILINYSPVIGLSFAYSSSYFIVMPLVIMMIKKYLKTSPLNIKLISCVVISSAIGAYLGLRISTIFDSNFVGMLAGGTLCALIIAIGSHFARDEIITIVKVFYNRKQKENKN